MSLCHYYYSTLFEIVVLTLKSQRGFLPEAVEYYLAPIGLAAPLQVAKPVPPLSTRHAPPALATLTQWDSTLNSFDMNI